MVDNAINRGVAGIVLAPSDPDALIPVVKKARENGIAVVLIDSSLNTKAEKYYQAFLSTDNRKAGALAAQELLKANGKEGKVSIMSFTPGARLLTALVVSLMSLKRLSAKNYRTILFTGRHGDST